MSRRATTKEKTVKSDPIYRNQLVNMLVNRILKHEKKNHGLINYLLNREKKFNKRQINPLFVLSQAIRRVTPNIAIKARCVGRSTYQVPIEIGSTQGKTHVIHWLLRASRKRLGRNTTFKLSFELVEVAKGSGDAIRKKEETHKVAKALSYIYYM